MWGGQSCPLPPFQAAFLVGARRLESRRQPGLAAPLFGIIVILHDALS